MTIQVAWGHQSDIEAALRRGEAVAPTLHQIITEICEKHGVSRTDILSPRRDRKTAYARMEGYWRARRETPASLPQIARAFGNRNHTTVMHGIKEHERRNPPTYPDK